MNLGQKIKITAAKPEDALGIVNVLHKTWHATYPNEELGIAAQDIEESFKDSFTEENIGRLADKIAQTPKNEKRLIAGMGDTVVGVATVVRNEHNNQLRTIYVLPEFQGKGIGKMLWDEAILFCDPAKDIIVHVAVYSQNTIEFYKRLGFVDTGKRFSDTGWRAKKMALIIPEMEMVIKAAKNSL
jgi:ribosomal protein S18 acetylase RimI-like enzyme